MQCVDYDEKSLAQSQQRRVRHEKPMPKQRAHVCLASSSLRFGIYEGSFSRLAPSCVETRRDDREPPGTTPTSSWKREEVEDQVQRCGTPSTREDERDGGSACGSPAKIM